MAIYKCGRGFELGRSLKQIQLVARARLEPGTAGLRVRRADHSATLPPCPFLIVSFTSAKFNPFIYVPLMIPCIVLTSCERSTVFVPLFSGQQRELVSPFHYPVILFKHF